MHAKTENNLEIVFKLSRGRPPRENMRRVDRQRETGTADDVLHRSTLYELKEEYPLSSSIYAKCPWEWIAAPFLFSLPHESACVERQVDVRTGFAGLAHHGLFCTGSASPPGGRHSRRRCRLPQHTVRPLIHSAHHDVAAVVCTLFLKTTEDYILLEDDQSNHF
jgi:hypothetical protein